MSNKLYSFLGLIQKSGNITSGDDTVELDIKKNKCKLLIIAEDASDNTKNRFMSIAEKKNIKCISFGNKIELGICIGKSQRSVLAIKDSKLANVFLNKFKEENYGGERIVKN